MDRFQFTLRDLFLAVTLIAVALPGIINPARFDDFGFNRVLVWLASWAAFGAGAGAPFHKKLIGGIVGTIVGIVVYYLLYVPPQML